MPDEPTDQQLVEWLELAEAWIPRQKRFAATIRALQATREQLKGTILEHSTEELTLQEQLDQKDEEIAILRNQRRAKDAIIRDWQKFAADLSNLLGCSSITDEVLKCVTSLRTELADVQSTSLEQSGVIWKAQKALARARKEGEIAGLLSAQLPFLTRKAAELQAELTKEAGNEAE